MALSKKQAKEISELITSVLVYQSIVENEKNEWEIRNNFMDYYDEKCNELAKFGITMTKYNRKGV
jgi:D-mannonate dehydratase